MLMAYQRLASTTLLRNAIRPTNGRIGGARRMEAGFRRPIPAHEKGAPIAATLWAVGSGQDGRGVAPSREQLQYETMQFAIFYAATKQARRADVLLNPKTAQSQVATIPQ
jgi:hypothetical protein